jgi:hypothetical protein
MRDIGEHFKERIGARYRHVEALYRRGARDPKVFGEMGRQIGQNVILGTPQGQRIQGSRAIAQFFKEMRRKGKADVKFTLKRFWILPTAHPVRTTNSTGKKVPVKHTCYYIMGFRLMGSVSTGGLAGTAIHIGGCPIKP